MYVGRFMCSLSSVLLCHLRSIYVKLDTFCSRHSLCLRKPLRFIFCCESLYVFRRMSTMCRKIFNFPVSISCLKYGRRQCVRKLRKTCENCEMKSRSLTGSGYEEGKILWAFSSISQPRLEMCGALTKFPIKDLTFFTSLVRQKSLKSGSKNRNKNSKNLIPSPDPTTEAFSIGKKFDHK